MLPWSQQTYIDRFPAWLSVIQIRNLTCLRIRWWRQPCDNLATIMATSLRLAAKEKGGCQQHYHWWKFYSLTLSPRSPLATTRREVAIMVARLLQGTLVPQPISWEWEPDYNKPHQYESYKGIWWRQKQRQSRGLIKGFNSWCVLPQKSEIFDEVCLPQCWQRSSSINNPICNFVESSPCFRAILNVTGLRTYLQMYNVYLMLTKIFIFI